jgi:hypothetical protein
MITYIFLALLSLTLLTYDKPGVPPAQTASTFLYTFNTTETLNEVGSMDESESPYFWLNSGGVMEINGSSGKTHQGNTSFLSKWRIRYGVSNPTDTDSGLHPQNIFRLITRSVWQNFSSEAYFKIVKDNISKSPNRNISNGLLLFSRYIDSNNAYYGGVRVDGTAIIKRKRNGEYYTLAQEKIFEGNYNEESNPNLLPKDTWIGIRTEIYNENDGSVYIRLYTDIGRTNTWRLALVAHDVPGEGNASNPIRAFGHAGIRTDFMDVEFQDFKLTNL